MTMADYVAFDRASDVRWEYVNGEAFAMTGASPQHGVVVRNVLTALTVALKGRPCRPLIDGQKIASTTTRAYHYPDVSVICGPPVRDADDDHAFTNPTLLVEVLSPTTRDYDLGGKFAHYRGIATLVEYVTIDPDARTIELRQKVADGRWLHIDVTGPVLALASIDVELDVDALWVDVDWVAGV